jgi:hypothetical protein
MSQIELLCSWAVSIFRCKCIPSFSPEDGNSYFVTMTLCLWRKLTERNVIVVPQWHMSGIIQSWMLSGVRKVWYSAVCIIFVFNLTWQPHIQMETCLTLLCVRRVVLAQFVLRVWCLWHRVSSETCELFRKFTSCTSTSALRRNQIS